MSFPAWVDMDYQLGVQVKDDGEGYGSKNKGAVGLENEVQCSDGFLCFDGVLMVSCGVMMQFQMMGLGFGLQVPPMVPFAEVSLEPYYRKIVRHLGYIAEAVSTRLFSDFDFFSELSHSYMALKTRHTSEAMFHYRFQYHTLHLMVFSTVFQMRNERVIVQVTNTTIPLSHGTMILVTENLSLLGVVDGISEPTKRRCYIVNCYVDAYVQSRTQLGNSVSLVEWLADNVLSDKDEKVSHEDDLSDYGKEAACKQILEMAERKNDQRQRNIAGNHQAPSDKNVNTRGTSSGSRVPSQGNATRENVGASRANVGPSQPRQTHGINPPAPLASVNPSNQFNPTAIGQVPPDFFRSSCSGSTSWCRSLCLDTALQPLHLNTELPIDFQ
ncbi:hypothetical protein AKJ16_DCAP11600 [Drosera capensis]